MSEKLRSIAAQKCIEAQVRTRNDTRDIILSAVICSMPEFLWRRISGLMLERPIENVKNVVWDNIWSTLPPDERYLRAWIPMDDLYDS